MADKKEKVSIIPWLIAVFIGTFVVSSMTMYVILKRIMEQRSVSNQPSIGGKQEHLFPSIEISASSVARTTAVLMQAPPDELTKRTLSFLLHQYQKQKALLKERNEQMEALAQENRNLAAAIKSMEERLASLAKDIEKQGSERTMAESDLQQTPPTTASEGVEQENNRQIKRVAELYNKMKPEEAQRIVAAIEDEDLLKLFSKMKPNAVARILALLETERAARLSERMMQ